MNLKELEVLNEVVGHKSFASAATALSYSPSVISNYISNVERELGLKLFVRSNKASSLKLTPEGAVIAKSIRRIVSDYHLMVELAEQLKNPLGNDICIGSQPRYGNIQEQEIIASFLLHNQEVNADIVKTNAADLVSLLGSGRIDAVFLCINQALSVEEYLHSILPDAEFEVMYIDSDKSLYFGMSEKYFPGRDEVNFGELADFAFSFSFSQSSDTQDKAALRGFEQLAEENGFKLRTVNIDAHDNTAFKLATMMPLAIGVTNVVAHYDGIKFVRIADWGYSTDLYFVYNRNNQKVVLEHLKDRVLEYIQSHHAGRRS